MSTLNDAIITLRNAYVFSNAETPLDIRRMQEQMSAQYPMVLSLFHLIDARLTSKKRHKGYYLVKRPNKTRGFLYYVRYIHEGKTIPSMWNTHTNIMEAAEVFAVENRERIIKKYQDKVTGRLFTVLGNYYKAGSKYLTEYENRNGKISERMRKLSGTFINKRFMPYLKDKNISVFAAVTVPVIVKFQNSLLDEGLKPQTINGYMSYIKRIFRHLVSLGEIDENVFNNVDTIKVSAAGIKIRGCHEIKKLSGVFNSEWVEDKRSYLLCLLIYSTGLRNSEIEKLTPDDIIKIDGCWFLNIKQSKTKNGVRVVPLHNFVYGTLFDYVRLLTRQ
jgi:hypothetical protein